MKLSGDSKPAVYDIRYHGHEVLPPVEDVNMNIRQRKSFIRTNFEN